MKHLTFLSVLIITVFALVGSLATPIPSVLANDFPRGFNGDSPNELPIPVIDVMPEIDSVAGWKWQPGIQVTITINGANYYATPDSSGEFDTGTIGYNIKAGDLVQVSDGTTSKVHTVYPLDLYSYDLEDDTLGGVAQPNKLLGAWVCTSGLCYSLTTTADGEGKWEIDFTGVMDIAPGSDGELWQPDSDDDYTVIFWQVPLVPTADVGLIADPGGFDDNGFNELAYQGLLKAQVDFGITPNTYASLGDDYVSKLNECISGGNELCIAVGFLFSDAIQTVASANPTVQFAILDSSLDATPPSNLRSIKFKGKEAAYLAGALAGKMTTSNKVGGVGGMQIPPVVELIEGYQNGAQCANANATVLKVYTGTFVNPDLGAATAADMIAKGADVIFGAAGPTGNGAILYSAQHDTWSIGVDSDQYLSVFGDGSVEGSDKLLTSAMKKLDNAVMMTIEDYLNLGSGTFGGNVYYGLNDGGVGLAPFHETADDISVEIKAYILGLETKIKNGTVSVDVTCFKPGPFSKSNPTNGATNQPPKLTLKWGKSANAASYEYCYDKTNDNKCGTGWKSVGTNTSKTLTGLTAGKYFWQVRARNARTLTYANNSTWWSFTVPPKPGNFTKTTPANGATKVVIKPILKWTASTNAVKYEYCIDMSNNNTCDSGWKYAGTNLQVALSSLLRGKLYYWQVRASNAMGTTLANSGTWWSFKTIP